MNAWHALLGKQTLLAMMRLDLIPHVRPPRGTVMLLYELDQHLVRASSQYTECLRVEQFI